MIDKLIPPIGIIYISTSSANPNTVYPDTTWVAWGSGRVPVGINTNDSSFNVVEKTGGEKTHTLTIAEMPNHSHTMEVGRPRNAVPERDPNDLDTCAWETRTTSSVGGNGSHNNLQPFIICFMWKRTS
jgi:microcystin-dependent protein